MLEYTSKNDKIHFIIFFDDPINDDVKFVIHLTLLPLSARKTKKLGTVMCHITMFWSVMDCRYNDGPKRL